MRGARAKRFQRLQLEPRDEHLEGAPARREHQASIEILDGAAACAHLDDPWRAKYRNDLAALAVQYRATRCASPVVELSQDPAFLVAQEALDFAPRGAQ